MSRKTSKVGEAAQASGVVADALIVEKAEAAAAALAAEEAAAVAAKEAADVVAAEEAALAAAAVAAKEAAEEAALATAVSRSASKFELSARAEEYLTVLLAQYFGTPTVDEYGVWLEAVESGNQVLVRNGPLQLETTDVPFVATDASTDLAGGDILLNVHRQLADVRLLD